MSPCPSPQSCTFHALLALILGFGRPFFLFAWYIRPKHFPQYVFFISSHHMPVPVQSWTVPFLTSLRSLQIASCLTTIINFTLSLCNVDICYFFNIFLLLFPKCSGLFVLYISRCSLELHHFAILLSFMSI